MLKFAGIILVSGAVSLMGANKASAIKENISARRELLGLLIHIKRSIEHTSTPLNIIYGTFESKALERCGFSELLKSGRTDAFKDALCSSRLVLPEKTAVLYKEIAENIGRSCFKKKELDVLERYIPQISAVDDELEKEDLSKIKLYRKLGILFGILAAVILI